MKELVCLLVVNLIAASATTAQNNAPAGPNTPPAPVQMTANQDHQRIVDLLKMTAVRQGRNGTNPQADNYANYDESKANPYPKLPDPLVLKNGRKVTTPEMWWTQRRPEIVEDFDREIYGRVPNNVPKVTWEVTSTTDGNNGDIPIKTKIVTGRVDNSSYPAITVNIQLSVTTPAKTTGPVPIIMQFGVVGGFGQGRGFGGTRGGRGANSAQPPMPARQFVAAMAPRGAAGVGSGAPTGSARRGGFGGPGWQQQLLQKGWGYAVISANSIQGDTGGALTQGIIGLCNKSQPRKLDDWGALRAWAWGVSRAMDYFETDKDVDARQVGLTGHSRYGKAALVAMAYDQRFAIAYPSSSGAGGAKLWRRDWGEVVENVAGSSEYHWMAGNFVKYSGPPMTWDDLPVDAHELVAMCAPRPVFISGGATDGDGWVDAKGMFLAAAGAGPVYKLLGKRDMGTTEFPPIETTLIDGDIAFRQHSGGHTDAPNWPTFIKFAERYLKTPATQ
jgi:hypothetical protein